MARKVRQRLQALTLPILLFAMSAAQAGAPTHGYTLLADANATVADAPDRNELLPVRSHHDLVVPQLSTNDPTAASAIQSVMDEYTATVDAGDLDAWLALWEPGGVQMPPGAPMRTGITAIRAGMEPVLTQFDDRIDINVLEATVAGDYAFARGTYNLTVSPKVGRRGEFGDLSVVDGKFLTVLHHEPDGSWKIYRDIFNSNGASR